MNRLLQYVSTQLGRLQEVPLMTILKLGGSVLFAIIVLAFVSLFLVAPTPRPARKSEKQYITILQDGSDSAPLPLPCWYESHEAQKSLAHKQVISANEAYRIEPAELFMTLVVPAYNEEQRLSGMLEEAVEFLERAYTTKRRTAYDGKTELSNGSPTKSQGDKSISGGWEILVVSDGSTDKTVRIALDFARSHLASTKPPTPAGPWTSNGGPNIRTKSAHKIETQPGDIPQGSIRVVTLEENRGKGGAVTHGMRHARGEYVVFADADGASRFSDLEKLVEGCERVKDADGRAVGIGSRAHLVGSEAVVKRSFIRNLLMYSFHLLLWLMTPPATAAIKDTQCGFKLFTRASLPYITPFMHSEGWIFDVEMLMLAESANIPMAEVAIGWKEVRGSKLNVVWDSLGMAWGLAVLRAAWMVGVYKRDLLKIV